MKVVFVLGATGSGKSQMALELAQKCSGAILNLDSVQAYEGLRIGSASPKETDFKLVPHYLYHFVNYPAVTTAGEFRRLALEVIQREQKNCDFFFIVSGNGFYSRVLECGTFPIPKADPSIQEPMWEILKEPQGEAELYQKLQQLDPWTAKKFASKDHYRLVRALEIIQVMKRPLSEIRHEFESSSEGRFPYPYLKIAVGAPRARSSDEPASAESCLLSDEARAWLRQRLTSRIDKMFSEGFLQEVHSLLRLGYSRDWHPLQSAGYREVVNFFMTHPEQLEQTLCPSSDELPEQILTSLKQEVLQAHLKLAKKQRTWFSQESNLFWVEAENFKAALEWIRK